MRRILITGASGMLGRITQKELSQNENWTVVGQAFTRAGDQLVQADLTDSQQVARLVDETRPDCIVHCAAERRPDISEGDKPATDALNQHAVATLARLCAEKDIFFIYLSTDYVFDGSQAPYATDATPNPLNHYGRSKLAGEVEARACGKNALILRVPILYGEVESLDESAVTIIATLLSKREPQSVDHWSKRFPTHTGDVARVIAQIVARRERDPEFHGTYHWSGSECLTKYEMALLMADAWQMSADHLSPAPDKPQGAPRPYDCQLDTSKLEALGIGAHTPFPEGIAQALAPFKPKTV